MRNSERVERGREIEEEGGGGRGTKRARAPEKGPARVQGESDEGAGKGDQQQASAYTRAMLILSGCCMYMFSFLRRQHPLSRPRRPEGVRACQRVLPPPLSPTLTVV